MLKPEDVAAYLKQNPAFLECYPDLLAEPEPTPFHDRQIEVLKGRQAIQTARYEEVVDSARNNLELERLLHEFAQRLLRAADRSVDTGCAILTEHFSLSRSSVVDKEQAAGTDELGLLAQRVAHGSSICDDRVSTNLLEILFGADHNIRSCAFVPLNNAAASSGVLVLGAASVERFQPGMGAIFLDRIGELMAAFLSAA